MEGDCCFLNVGCGEDIAIKDLAVLISELVGFKGQLKFNTNMPDGAVRKILDVSKINNFGIYPKVSLKNGLIMAIEGYIKSIT